MDQISHEPLKYQQVDFAIHRLIEDCPPHTVVRELLKNAIEAASGVSRSEAIRWFVEDVDGVRKLGLYNEGPGMTAQQLRQYMDLASTGKQLGTDENFGQGAKVSGLKFSPAGLEYRSCVGGRVNAITLMAERQTGKTYPRYVKKRQRVEDEEGKPSVDAVVDVTDAYEERDDRDLNRDWTEVLLHGRDEQHDTVKKGIGSRANWLIREITQRFHTFPLGIEIGNADATSGQKNERTAKGLAELTLRWCEKDGRYEDVEAEHPEFGPLIVRYHKLNGIHGGDAEANILAKSRAGTMEAYGVGTRGDHIAIVWKGECYTTRSPWGSVAGPFGVTFGSADVAIHILLPDNAPVRNNTYRDALLKDTEHAEGVELVDDFADLVRESRPHWLIDYVEERGRRSSSGADVMDRLKNYLDDLLVKGERRPRVRKGEGDDEGEETTNSSGDGDSNGGNGSDPRTSRSHRPTTGRKVRDEQTGIPKVMFSDDPALLDQMKDRAAMYQRDENTVFLNQNHFRYEDDLERLYEEVGDDVDRRKLAKDLFDDEYMFRAGTFVVQAWLFKSRPHWDDTQLEEALGSGAMTVHLASREAYSDARHKLRTRLHSAKREAKAAEKVAE